MEAYFQFHRCTYDLSDTSNLISIIGSTSLIASTSAIGIKTGPVSFYCILYRYLPLILHITVSKTAAVFLHLQILKQQQAMGIFPLTQAEHKCTEMNHQIYRQNSFHYF